MARKRVVDDGKIWFYREGEEFVEITDGWTTEGLYSLSAGTGTGSVQKNIDSLQVNVGATGSNNHYVRGYTTNTKVNFNNINSLNVLCDITKSGGAYVWLQLGEKSDPVGTGAAVLSVNTAGTGKVLTLDTSALAGQYHINIHANSNYNANVGTLELKVYKVWGEA